jgi:predicted nucleic acid-binding protein
VDTDTCSAYLKSNPLVERRFLQYTGGLYISAVTLGELFTWVLRGKSPPSRLQDLQALLNDVTVLDVTVDVARKFGEIRAGLLDRGLPAPKMDLVNAATALVHNLTLVTHNTQDFINIPGLRLTDWLVP